LEAKILKEAKAFW